MLLDVSPLRRHRDYRLLYIGQTVSFFGTMLTYVAVPYQVFQLTHSSFWVGALGTFQLVPLLVAGLWGGALADSLDRRRMLVTAEIAMAIGSTMLFLNAARERPSVVAIFVVSALMSGINGFHRPALEAMTPRLVERDDIPSIAALGSLKYNIAAIGGPTVSGLLIANLGATAAYGLDVASFAVSVVCLALLRAPKTPPSAEGSPLARVAEGLAYARRRPELVGTYVVDIVAMTFAMPMALFPVMSQQWGGATAAGWLYASMAMGSLAMTVFSGTVKGIRRHGAAVVVSAAIWGVAIVALGFTGSLWTAVFCLAIAGAADTVSGLFRMTIWNQTIPDQFRGRLAGVEMISYMMGPLLGNARAGAIASWSTVQISIVSGGLLCVAGVLLCIPALPAFWRYIRVPDSDAPAPERAAAGS